MLNLSYNCTSVEPINFQGKHRQQITYSKRKKYDLLPGTQASTQSKG